MLYEFKKARSKLSGRHIYKIVLGKAYELHYFYFHYVVILFNQFFQELYFD